MIYNVKQSANTISGSHIAAWKNDVSFLNNTSDHFFKTPEEMMKIIAISLNMDSSCYQMRSRLRNIVELRFIAAVLMRIHFPYVTLQQIANLFGGQDHSSVISGIARANALIYTRDPGFVSKYHIADKAVNIWLQKMGSQAA